MTRSASIRESVRIREVTAPTWWSLVALSPTWTKFLAGIVPPVNYMHTNFRGSRETCSGEKNFKRKLTLKYSFSIITPQTGANLGKRTSDSDSAAPVHPEIGLRILVTGIFFVGLCNHQFSKTKRPVGLFRSRIIEFRYPRCASESDNYFRCRSSWNGFRSSLHPERGILFCVLESRANSKDN